MIARQTLLIVAALIVSALPVWPQRDRRYDASVVSQVRIDLRELGYPVLSKNSISLRVQSLRHQGLVHRKGYLRGATMAPCAWQWILFGYS